MISKKILFLMCKRKKALPKAKYYNFSQFSGPGDKSDILFFVEDLVTSLETRGYLGEVLGFVALVSYHGPAHNGNNSLVPLTTNPSHSCLVCPENQGKLNQVSKIYYFTPL